MSSSSNPSPAPGQASPPDGPAATAPVSPQDPHPQRIPRWLERSELFLRVLIRLYIGLTIACVPWSRLFWDQNPLFQYYPDLGAWAMHGWVRGLVSGLGLLNLWIAFRDAIHHRNG